MLPLDGKTLYVDLHRETRKLSQGFWSPELFVHGRFFPFLTLPLAPLSSIHEMAFSVAAHGSELRERRGEEKL